jgi:hypothetical protein
MSRDEVLEQLRAECQEDHVGLWQMVNAVQQDLGIRGDDDVRAATLDLVRALLAKLGIEIGLPAPDGRHFNAWKLSPDEAAKAIEEKWTALGRNPTIGEVAWFNGAGR